MIYTLKAKEVEAIIQQQALKNKIDFYFFSKKSKRFFNSIILSGYQINNLVYFITKERFKNELAKYTIRFCDLEDANLEIEVIGNFQGFTTAGKARKALLNALNNNIIRIK
ncbi:MAG: hypothetical protein ACO3TG_03890 [Minisyncoccia bacterium]